MLQLKDKTNKLRPIWLVNDQYRFGFSEHCEVKIEGAALAATLNVAIDHLELVPERCDITIEVNLRPVNDSVVLKPGDEFNIGQRVFVVYDPSTDFRVGDGLVRKTLTTDALVLHSDSDPDTVFTVRDGMVVGRSHDAEIRIDMQGISREHAVFRHRDHRWTLIDLDSSNGTFLNGKVIKEEPVAYGDELRFGPIKLHVGRAEGNGDVDKTSVRPALDVNTLRKKTNLQKKHKSKPVKSADSVKTDDVLSVVTDNQNLYRQNKVLTLIAVILFASFMGVCYYLFLF